jgi:magnesium transporter
MGKYSMPLVEHCLVPIVLRLGGSTAMQSITLVQKGLLNPEVERARALKVLWDQIWVTIFVVTLMSGSLYFYAVYRFAGLSSRVPYLSLGFLVVGLFSLLVGVALPLIFRLLKMDTLRASSRFVHFIMDALSLLVFFGFMFIGR